MAPWGVLPQRKWEATGQFYVEGSCDWVWILEALSSHYGEESWETGKEGSPAFSADPVALPLSLLSLSL